MFLICVATPEGGKVRSNVGIGVYLVTPVRFGDPFTARHLYPGTSLYLPTWSVIPPPPPPGSGRLTHLLGHGLADDMPQPPPPRQFLESW